MNQSKIQIFNGDLSIDETIYQIETQDKQWVSIKASCCNSTNCDKCNGTGIIKRCIHHTRIAKMFDTDGRIIYEADDCKNQNKSEVESHESTSEAINWAKLKTDNELFTKVINFDHGGVKAEAHVLIANDKKTFQVFNTYNGSLGKKGKTGKTYPISSLKAYERKIEQLKKQGYIKC